MLSVDTVIEALRFWSLIPTEVLCFKAGVKGGLSKCIKRDSEELWKLLHQSAWQRAQMGKRRKCFL